MSQPPQRPRYNLANMRPPGSRPASNATVTATTPIATATADTAAADAATSTPNKSSAVPSEQQQTRAGGKSLPKVAAVLKADLSAERPRVEDGGDDDDDDDIISCVVHSSENGTDVDANGKPSDPDPVPQASTPVKADRPPIKIDARAIVSPTPKKPAVRRDVPKKVAVLKEDDEDEDEAVADDAIRNTEEIVREKVSAAPKKPTPKKGSAPAKHPTKEVDEAMDDDDRQEAVSERHPPKPVAKPRVSGKKEDTENAAGPEENVAKKKKKVIARPKFVKPVAEPVDTDDGVSESSVAVEQLQQQHAQKKKKATAPKKRPRSDDAAAAGAKAQSPESAAKRPKPDPSKLTLEELKKSSKAWKYTMTPQEISRSKLPPSKGMARLIESGRVTMATYETEPPTRTLSSTHCVTHYMASQRSAEVPQHVADKMKLTILNDLQDSVYEAAALGVEMFVVTPDRNADGEIGSMTVFSTPKCADVLRLPRNAAEVTARRARPSEWESLMGADKQPGNVELGHYLCGLFNGCISEENESERPSGYPWELTANAKEQSDEMDVDRRDDNEDGDDDDEGN